MKDISVWSKKKLYTNLYQKRILPFKQIEGKCELKYCQFRQQEFKHIKNTMNSDHDKVNAKENKYKIQNDTIIESDGDSTLALEKVKEDNSYDEENDMSNKNTTCTNNNSDDGGAKSQN